MKKLICCITAALCVGQALAKPNVVLIMADDFGIGSINACGAAKELVRTPNLNRLADAGMRFNNANTPGATCSPTRYALLTGRYAWRGPLAWSMLTTRWWSKRIA